MVIYPEIEKLLLNSPAWTTGLALREMDLA
jgi:hypothetical protein